MKKLTIIIMMLACVSTMKAEAFSFGNIFNRASRVPVTNSAEISAANMASVLLDMQNRTSTVDKQVQNSLAQIASQLSNSTTETEALNSKMNTLISNSYKNNIEQYNEMSKLMSEYASILKNNKTNVSTTINNMTEAQKTALLNNIIDIAKGSQEYARIAKLSAEKSAKILKASNRAADVISNLNTINTMVIEIRDRAKTTIAIANQLRSIAKAAGVSTF